MTPIFHALWLLCALSTAVFATAAARTLRGLSVFPIAFGASVFFHRAGHLPDAIWIGAMVAFLSVFQLVRPGTGVLAAAASGVVAGVWASLLEVDGLAVAPAVAIAAALPAAAAYLAAWRPRFAPLELREEALLAMLVFGLVLATVPTVLDGWRSAVALNMQVTNARQQLVPVWALGATSASIALGGLYSLWRRG
jgi:hypothetical protein